jgi:hypothetical protein
VEKSYTLAENNSQKGLNKNNGKMFRETRDRERKAIRPDTERIAERRSKNNGKVLRE